MNSWLLTIFLCGISCATAQMRVSAPFVYRGLCDASAAVELSEQLFAVASDEDNQIRIYQREETTPVRAIDLSDFLEVEKKSPETDLEGAARIGDRIYWIGSHGRNRDGRVRFNRRRFFATTIQGTGRDVRLVPMGKPYKRLLDDLGRDPRLKPFKLEAASRLMPKLPGALNIEGLCATPEGHLLIGFRNPIPRGQALLVPLLNPAQVIQGKRATFGDPILLDLGGQGIRDIDFYDGKYVIIAGAYDGKGQSHLYQWNGGADKPKRWDDVTFKHFNPEAIIYYPDKSHPQFQILSDDGTRTLSGVPCKTLEDPMQRRFRSVWITP